MNLAIVTPRYGAHIVGGAETLARTLAEYLARQQWRVTVLTTCAQDHVSWENRLPAGVTTENNVTVHRFPVRQGDTAAHIRLSHQLHNHYYLPLADEYEWLASGPHAPGLYAYLEERQEQFDAILALPYLSPIVQYAAWSAPEKTCLIPCLHEEPPAFMALLRLLLETVRGILFLTPEEAQFAWQALYVRSRRHAVMGAGIDPPPERLPAVNLPDAPYIVAASRLEAGKNLALLYEYTQRYVEEGGDLQLVLLGAGRFTPPDHAAFHVAGFVSHTEKLVYMQNALALCQPSLLESFSLVLMESWQMGRPVLVHEDCAVTAGHVARSGGGLTFGSYKTFAGAIDWLKARPDEAARLGRQGQQYVASHYRWPAVAARLQKFLELCATS